MSFDGSVGAITSVPQGGAPEAWDERRCGASDRRGVELPAEVLERLQLKAGDALLLFEAADGSLRIARSELGRDEPMRIAREGMLEFREALRELAK